MRLPRDQHELNAIIESRLSRERARLHAEHERELAEVRAELERLRAPRGVVAWIRHLWRHK
jgi:hypothetical protein